jgi:hypothetical protein
LLGQTILLASRLIIASCGVGIREQGLKIRDQGLGIRGLGIRALVRHSRFGIRESGLTASTD